MELSTDLIANALIAGLLLGGFYAAMTLGLTISFGLLDVVNIAHPAFILTGSYVAYAMNSAFGLDPIVAGLITSPLAFMVGFLLYHYYRWYFERSGDDSLRGLAFFFGLMLIVEVSLILIFGVDYRTVRTAYQDVTPTIGAISFPLRMLIPFCVSVLLVALVQLVLSLTFFGRTVRAVSQDRVALQLMAGDPIRVKAIAFGVSVALATIAGSLLIVIQPVEPSIMWLYVGIPFAICVLGGMGSISGTLVAALLLGVAESLTSVFWGPSWSPALAFGVLLLVIGFKPAGLFGR
jgi:branched-chain amino acid transport system permease protein